MNKIFTTILKTWSTANRTFLSRKMQSLGTTNTISTIDPGARMIWVDMELTGLDLEKDVILEIACVITEENLDIVAQAPTLIIHQSQEVLNRMGPWCRKQHSKSGLITECLNSTLSIEDADEKLYNFVKTYVPQGKGCVAGNSVYMDKWHVIKYLPKLNSHLHYRLLDVSTLKELCRRWRCDDFKKIPEKAYVHRALDDIMESIDELKHYKRILFDK